MTRPKGTPNKPKITNSDSVEDLIAPGKPDRAPRNHKPSGPIWKESASIEKTLTGTIETLGLGVGFINVIDGKIIGAIGVSGGTSQQDGQCARAGAAAATAVN